MNVPRVSGTGAGSSGQWPWHGAAGVQEVSGQCPQTYGVGGAVWGQELDSMILIGPIQLRVFYDSMKWQLLILATEEINHGFSLEA